METSMNRHHAAPLQQARRINRLQELAAVIEAPRVRARATRWRWRVAALVLVAFFGCLGALALRASNDDSVAERAFASGARMAAFVELTR